MKDKLKIDGKEYDILVLFESNNTGKEYVIYTDHSKDENGNIICLSSMYDNGKIHPIDSKEEQNLIDDIISNMNF